jgi:3-hydroxyisobutyrate dehydrogenase-like beta-hydroxyacid dehydrogenase
MTVSFIDIRRVAAGAASLIAAVVFSGPLSRAADDDAGAQVKPVFVQTLPNVPGKSVTAIVVSYAPGGLPLSPSLAQGSRASITMPAAFSPTSCRARSNPRTRRPDRSGSTIGEAGSAIECIEKEKAMRVGMIGLGRMGAGMAANLLQGGHEVVVYNRTPAKAEALVGQGAKAVADVSDACRGDAVVTMLANDSAVEGIVLGGGGVIDSLPAGALHVSGSPLFEAMGQKTFVVSETPRIANLVKLSGNFLIASAIEALGEAMALVGKGGLDRRQYLEVLTSTLFNVPVYKTYGGLIASEAFEPAGFAAPLGYKDIQLTLAAADDLRVPMPLASLLRDRLLTLLAQGDDALDWSAIGHLAARDAGSAGG